jgi:hypothetical protein
VERSHGRLLRSSIEGVVDPELGERKPRLSELDGVLGGDDRPAHLADPLGLKRVDAVLVDVGRQGRQVLLLENE